MGSETPIRLTITNAQGLYEEYGLVIIESNQSHELCPLSVIVLLSKSELSDIAIRSTVGGGDYA